MLRKGELTGRTRRGRVRVIVASHRRVTAAAGVRATAHAAATVASRNRSGQGRTAGVRRRAERHASWSHCVLLVGGHAERRRRVVGKRARRGRGLPARKRQATLVPVRGPPHRSSVLGGGDRPGVGARRRLAACLHQVGAIRPGVAGRDGAAAPAVPTAAQATARRARLVSRQRSHHLPEVGQRVVVPGRGGPTQAGRARCSAAVAALVAGKVVGGGMGSSSGVPRTRVTCVRGAGRPGASDRRLCGRTRVAGGRCRAGAAAGRRHSCGEVTPIGVVAAGGQRAGIAASPPPSPTCVMPTSMVANGEAGAERGTAVRRRVAGLAGGRLGAVSRKHGRPAVAGHFRAMVGAVGGDRQGSRCAMSRACWARWCFLLARLLLVSVRIATLLAGGRTTEAVRGCARARRVAAACCRWKLSVVRRRARSRRFSCCRGLAYRLDGCQIAVSRHIRRDIARRGRGRASSLIAMLRNREAQARFLLQARFAVDVVLWQRRAQEVPAEAMTAVPVDVLVTVNGSHSSREDHRCSSRVVGVCIGPSGGVLIRVRLACVNARRADLDHGR